MDELISLEQNEPYNLEVKRHLISAYRQRGQVEEAALVRARLVDLAPLTEREWLDWIQESEYIEIYTRAFKDFYYPQLAIRFLKYCKSTGQDIDKEFNTLSNKIRRSELWDSFRELLEDPDEIRKNYRRQFSVPMPDMDNSWKNYLDWEKDEEAKQNTRDKYLNTFSKWKSEEVMYEQFQVLLQERNDQLVPFLDHYLKKVPEHLRPSIYEEALLKISTDPSLWQSYAMNMTKHKLEMKRILKRAIRNCPEDIDLWSLLLLSQERLNKSISSNFYIEYFNKAIQTSFPYPQYYTKLWKDYINYLRRSSQDYLDMMLEGEQWLENYIPPEHIYLRLYRAELTLNIELFEEIAHEQGAAYAVWSAYLSYLLKHSSHDQVRHVYRRAVEYTKDYPVEICNQWLEWESVHGNIDSLFEARNKVYKRLMRKDVIMSRQQKNLQTTKGKEETNERFTVFVRPVPLSVKEDQLADFFSQVVPVKHSRIVRDKRGKSRGFAYIDLFSRADLEECVRNFNGREFEGKILYVAESKPPSESNKDEFTVFVNNLAYSTEENDLRSLMAEYGDISSIRIIRDESGKCKGFAYVEFYNQESVQKAIGDGVRELLGRRVMLLASDSTKEKSHILHVGNLEYSVTEEQVAALFAGVKKVHIPTDKTGKSRGFALVEFVDEDSARNALNSEKLVMNDRPIVIKRSTRNIKPARAEVMRNEDFKKLLG